MSHILFIVSLPAAYYKAAGFYHVPMAGYMTLFHWTFVRGGFYAGHLSAADYYILGFRFLSTWFGWVLLASLAKTAQCPLIAMNMVKKKKVREGKMSWPPRRV
ncbi:hypothetical protein, partial [Idiomarina zobellii]|uniref:hypothetical protein n=1 Tax=Idiomarina zobellii TaxID=86103 RepID=UPI001F2CFED1